MITLEEYRKAKSVVFDFERQQKQHPENCLEFNINDHVLIRLKESGYKHWLEHENKLIKDDRFKKTLSDLTGKENKEGFVQIQLWQFMEIFGNSLVFGAIPIFNANVRFYKDDLKACK